MKWKEAFNLGDFLPNAILGTEMSKELWLQGGNDMITPLESIIADEFLNKQQCIINVRAQHCIGPVGICVSDFPSE